MGSNSSLDGIEGATLTNDDLNEINKFFPIESADGSSSSAREGRSRSTRANNTPNPVEMPFATCNTNKTPKHRGKANIPAHQLRCDLCVGFPYGQLVEFQQEKKTARGNASATPWLKEFKRTVVEGRTTFVTVAADTYASRHQRKKTTRSIKSTSAPRFR